MDLKQVASTEEQVKPTSEPKQEEPTQPKAKDSTLGKTYTEEEFRKAQSGWSRQVSLSDAGARKAQADLDEAKADTNLLKAELDDLRKEQEEILKQQDDPELVKSYKSRTSIAAHERELASRESKLAKKLQEAEEMAFSAAMDRRAAQVMRETGCPLEELKGSTNEHEVELRALKWQMAQKAEETETPPTFDTGVSTGAGTGKLTIEQVQKMSPEERFARAEEIARIPMGYKSLQ